MTERIEASSRAMSADDDAKREIALDVLRHSSEPVLNFAKLMVPTSLSSIGAVLAIGKDVVGPGTDRTVLLAACALALVAMVVFASAAYAQRVRVSLDDFEDIADELLSLSRRRQRLVTAAMVLFIAAVAVAVVGLLG